MAVALSRSIERATWLLSLLSPCKLDEGDGDVRFRVGLLDYRCIRKFRSQAGLVTVACGKSERDRPVFQVCGDPFAGLQAQIDIQQCETQYRIGSDCQRILDPG